MVLALGGGFQAYFKQKRDGSIYDEQMPVMAEVAKFCRARQAICHHAEPVPQVALLLLDGRRTTAGSTGCSRATCRGSAACCRPCWRASSRSKSWANTTWPAGWREYPLIVVPEWEYLEPKFKRGTGRLREGRRQPAAGRAQDRRPVRRRTGRHARGRAASRGTAFPRARRRTGRDEGPDASRAAWAAGRAVRRAPRIRRSQLATQPAASITALGRGQIAATYFTFGQGYLEHAQPTPPGSS